MNSRSEMNSCNGERVRSECNDRDSSRAAVVVASHVRTLCVESSSTLSREINIC
jgi:hypothetical protein